MSGRDRHRELADRCRTSTASVSNLAEVGNVAGSQVLGDFDFVGRFHRVGGQSVDFARRDSGVVECGQDRGEREFLLRTLELLGELGLTDADDRRRVFQHFATLPPMAGP